MTNWSEGTVQANGITIQYHRTDGDNQRSLLLLHGFTDNGLCWTRVARDLAGNYAVIMTDARGHGRSDGIATGFSVTILADDAAAVIHALGLQTPVLFGHSMGAITALQAAAAYPDLVRAIVLEDPPLLDQPATPANEAQQDQQAWQMIASFKVLSRAERIARGVAMNPQWSEEEIIPWADSKAEFHIADPEPARAALTRMPWRELIARSACPILLLTGDPELGALVTPEAAQEAARLWRHGEIVPIPGAGHSIHRDRYAETMAAVRAFLKRV